MQTPTAICKTVAGDKVDASINEITEDVNAPDKSTAIAHVFDAVFDRSSGEKLGISVQKDEEGIVVTSILDGAVAVWNSTQSCSRSEVQVGDRIFEVNGVRGDGAKLASECKQNKKLYVKITKAEAFGYIFDDTSVEDHGVTSLVANVFNEVNKEQVKDLAGSLSKAATAAAAAAATVTAAAATAAVDAAATKADRAADAILDAADTASATAAPAIAEVAAAATTVDEFAAYKLSGWLGDNGSYGQATRQPGRVHKFSSEQGAIEVLEEGCLMREGSMLVSRARSTNMDTSYDLRRLCMGCGSNGGGFIELRHLLKAEREVNMMSKISPNDHVVRCHASAIENFGRMHCRLLLTDPCVLSVAEHVAANGGVLQAAETSLIGHQLAQGLLFLHRNGIICGSVSPTGVLRGMDGLWKLGDLGFSTGGPVDATEWREMHGGVPGNKDEPPEAQVGCSDTSLKVTTMADMWLLGVLLANTCLGFHPFESADGEATSKDDFRPPPHYLLESLNMRLCMMIQWLMEVEPSNRLEAWEAASILESLRFTSAAELLPDMPTVVQSHASEMIDRAAQQLATQESSVWALTCLHNALMSSPDGTVPAGLSKDDDDCSAASTEDPPSRDEEHDGVHAERPGTPSVSDSRSDSEVEDQSCTGVDSGTDILSKIKSPSIATADTFNDSDADLSKGLDSDVSFLGNPFEEDSPFVAVS